MTDMNPRTCIVTREEKSPDEMVRFVIGPGGSVVPDLKRKLPGRGAWVTLDRSTVEAALRKNLFSRSFRQEIVRDDSICDMVDQLLEKEALNYLSLARKAGQAVTGFMKVETSIRSGEIAVLVHADDAKEDGRQKLAQALRVSGLDDVAVFDCFSGLKLDQHLGNDNTVHVAVLNSGLARGFIASARRLMMYRGHSREH